SLDLAVHPRLAAGEDQVRMGVQPVAGTAAGRQRFVQPCLPWPKPDWINVRVEDKVDGDHRLRRSQMMGQSVGSSMNVVRPWRLAATGRERSVRRWTAKLRRGPLP